MIDQLDIAAVLAGLAILLVCAGLALRAERARLEARLRAFLGSPEAPEPSLIDTQGPNIPGERHRLLRLTKIGAAPHELAQAGLSISPRRFLAYQGLSLLAGIVVGRLLAARFGFDAALLPVLTGVSAILGLWLPRFVLKMMRSRRVNRFEKQLPQAVDAIANSLEAGLSLPQSIELIGRDMPKPLGPEFSRVFRELGLGLSLGEALRGLVHRMPLNDVEIFVTAIEIQYRTGGNLSRILRGIAHTIRERLRIRGEIRVMTAQQKLSGYIVSGLPIAIAGALKLMNPSYVDRLGEPGIMRIMVLAAIAGIVCGYYAMMRIADIEV